MGRGMVGCRGRLSDTRPGVRWDVAQIAFVDDAEAIWQASSLDCRTYDGQVVSSPVCMCVWLFPMRQCGRLRWMEH